MARKVLMTSTPWHPGYPFRPRGGRVRRIGSVLTLATLSALISAYWYVTDSKRVRQFAEHYLTEAVGGRVTVGRARLSIFEGLRLDDVTVKVDDRNAPDSTLLTATTLHVRVPVLGALSGDLSGVSILAVEPRALLVSSAETRTWNFQRLPRPQTTTRPAGPRQPSRITLPQVLLRNARIEFAELVSGKLVRNNTPIAVEGNLIPDKDKPALYTFAVSARGASDKTGTSLTGWTYPPGGQLSARMRNVDLGGSFAALLPREVREWWERHAIEGKIEIPDLYVGPPADSAETKGDGRGISFRLVTSFEGGAMSLRPEELRGRPTTHPSTEPSAVTTERELAVLPPIRFENVRGALIFTESGIELKDMSLMYEGSRLEVAGSLGGYSPGSPLSLRIACRDLRLGEDPAFVPSLPPEVREVYDRFRPSGEGNFAFTVVRDAAGKVATEGRLDIVRGKMTFDRFAFPVHDISGAIVVSQFAPGQTRLEVENLRGRGRADGPNANADLRIEGFMCPLEGGSEVNFSIRGDNVQADDELVAAMPEGVRSAIRLFDPKGTAYPQFGGSFTTEVYRAPGRVSVWRWPIDVTLTHGTGRFEPFPYPLENVTGRVLIRSGYVDLDHVTTTRGPAKLVVGGRVTYADQPPGRLLYDLTIDGRAIAVDATLVNAIPPDKRKWLTTLGVGGTLVVGGKVTGNDARYELDLSLSDGTLRPKAGAWLATGVTGEMRLTPTSIAIKSVRGDRAGAAISAEGTIAWPTGELLVNLNATAKRLPFDADLRSILEPSERAAWDAVKPEGNADVAVRISPDLGTVYSFAPLGMSATPAAVPVRVVDIGGTVVVGNGRIEMNGLTATRNGSELSLQGVGSTQPRGRWDVALGAKNLAIDDELRAALPAMLRETVNGIALAGRANVVLRKFTYTPPASAPAVASVHPLATPPAPGDGASADFDFGLEPIDLTLSLGVPVRATGGKLNLTGSIRDDRLDTTDGDIAVSAGEMSGRAFHNFRATVEKTADRRGLKLSNISGTLADGELSGFAVVAFPEDGTTKYGIDLSLRNADVETLVGKVADTPVSGRMSASLTLQGDTNDPRSRRGRGDISVTGENMARVPVLLGLVQIANLSLPGGTSFNNATARYNMDGPKIRFEQLVLRSPGMQIDGSGMIDMESRQVRLTLWTAPVNGPRLPLFSDFVDRTRRELLQITIRGTIDNPKIGANSFDSFTTTVEEVFKSTGRSDREPTTRSKP